MFETEAKYFQDIQLILSSTSANKGFNSKLEEKSFKLPSNQSIIMQLHYTWVFWIVYSNATSWLWRTLNVAENNEIQVTWVVKLELLKWK